MSILVTDELIGRRDGGHVIAVPRGTNLYAPGHVIQTVWRKMDLRTSFAANNDTVSRDIDGLNLTITLKRANSEVHLKWYVFHESHHDITFQAKRGGTVIGFNSADGNIRWSGIGVGEYEHTFDNSSTPTYMNLAYVDIPGTVGPHTYSLGCRSSSGANYTVHINRTVAQVGTDSYETGVSWCIIEEVAR
jgi:hypothetical protein